MQQILKTLVRNATSAIAEVAEVVLCAFNSALPTSERFCISSFQTPILVVHTFQTFCLPLVKKNRQHVAERRKREVFIQTDPDPV